MGSKVSSNFAQLKVQKIIGDLEVDSLMYAGGMPWRWFFHNHLAIVNNASEQLTKDSRKYSFEVSMEGTKNRLSETPYDV